MPMWPWLPSHTPGSRLGERSRCATPLCRTLPGQSHAAGTTHSILSKLAIAAPIVRPGKVSGEASPMLCAASQQGRPATRRPSLLKGRAWLRAALSYAYLGDGSCLSGLVDGLGLDGSGPLLSEAVGPPGVVAGTFP
jgi:hypothetical protein